MPPDVYIRSRNLAWLPYRLIPSLGRFWRKIRGPVLPTADILLSFAATRVGPPRSAGGMPGSVYGEPGDLTDIPTALTIRRPGPTSSSVDEPWTTCTEVG